MHANTALHQRGFFLTSSGTDSGKTTLACMLVRSLGWEAFKPVISGFDAAHVADTDTGRLLRAANKPLDDAHIKQCSPWRFRAAISPHLAAKAENVSLSLPNIYHVLQKAVQALPVRQPILIEGAGGVLSPLCNNHTNADLISVCGLPAILVVENYLGAISHGLCAFEALLQRGIMVAAVIVNTRHTVQDACADDIIASFRHFIPSTIPLAELPYIEDADSAELPTNLHSLFSRLSP